MNEKNLEDSIVELEAIRGNSWLPPISTSLDGFRVMLPEKHRTPAGSLFCRPASTAQSVLALLVRRGFVDYLNRHCQIYRRSSATRWCLKDKRTGQNPYTHYIILSLILPYLGGWHQSSFNRWSHSSSISVSYGHPWHSFDLATYNVVSKHGVQDHVFACLVLCIYIYLYAYDILGYHSTQDFQHTPNIHQLTQYVFSMGQNWCTNCPKRIIELFVLIFCTASFWCPIIFTCFEILDPDINQKDTRVLVVCVLMCIPYNIRTYICA